MDRKLRTALLVLSGIMTVWFIIPVVFSGIINIGNITGIVLFGSLFTLTFLGEKVLAFVKKIRNKKIGKVTVNVACIVLIAIFLLATAETALMVGAAAKDPEPSATVVVLGCRVYGERPSRMMVARLKAAQNFLEKNPDSSCILSGGQGEDEDISEAECMYRYLVAAGISPDRLYKEDKSTSTRENLLFSKEIIERENLNPEIAIATNEFHEYRAQRIASSIGLESGAVSGKTEIWVVPTYHLRELYGILYEWIV